MSGREPKTFIKEPRMCGRGPGVKLLFKTLRVQRVYDEDTNVPPIPSVVWQRAYDVYKGAYHIRKGAYDEAVSQTSECVYDEETNVPPTPSVVWQRAYDVLACPEGGLG